ncbi:MAG: DUF3375 family protein [Ilumatobacteraceae bacterium]|nr:DUF3375 family protein [Ilumatobacteraceae bacterium]
MLEYAHAPLTIAFLHRVFVVLNVRSISQPELVEALEDELYAVRAVRGEQAMPRPALEYLVDWSSNERGWLRRFYPATSDEPYFDLTPASEQAITWVARLTDRPFVGTESRLRSLFDLLEQMAVSTEPDPEVRLADLERRRAEIEQVRQGNLEVIDDRVLKERFHQFVSLARELLADFAIYLRQVDIPGVHTKFIEQHQRTLAAMLDSVLPESAVEVTAGHSEVARRYGFRGRPRLVRFRYLDRRLALTTIDQDRQYSLTAADFGRIDPPRRIFMTENEINFLALPDAPDSMAVFGAGSGFDHLIHVPWLAEVPLHYWGDIDTHGFAILDQLRGYAPHATSMLMDRETLLAHREFWGVEEKPTQRNLSRLTENEHGVYDDLSDNRLQPNLRLEQERIRFSWVQAAVQEACASVGPATAP